LGGGTRYGFHWAGIAQFVPPVEPATAHDHFQGRHASLDPWRRREPRGFNPVVSGRCDKKCYGFSPNDPPNQYECIKLTWTSCKDFDNGSPQDPRARERFDTVLGHAMRRARFFARRRADDMCENRSRMADCKCDGESTQDHTYVKSTCTEVDINAREEMFIRVCMHVKYSGTCKLERSIRGD
jgi:hypothetical protein